MEGIRRVWLSGGGGRRFDYHGRDKGAEEANADGKAWRVEVYMEVHVMGVE